MSSQTSSMPTHGLLNSPIPQSKKRGHTVCAPLPHALFGRRPKQFRPLAQIRDQNHIMWSEVHGDFSLGGRFGKSAPAIATLGPDLREEVAVSVAAEY